MPQGKPAAPLQNPGRTALKEQYKDSEQFPQAHRAARPLRRQPLQLLPLGLRPIRARLRPRNPGTGLRAGSTVAAERGSPDAHDRIVLSDSSAGMMHEARANLRERSSPAQFCQLDAGALSFKSGSFDLVVAVLMLYHLDDRPAAFAEIRRVLRTGGTLYASTMGRPTCASCAKSPAASLNRGGSLRRRSALAWRPGTIN